MVESVLSVRPTTNPLIDFDEALLGRLGDWRKSGSRSTMLTSNFRPEVEIWPFRACAMHPAIVLCGQSYGADTTFHKTHFWLFLVRLCVTVKWSKATPRQHVAEL